MRYKALGTTGLFVSELCLGTMTFGVNTGRYAAGAGVEQSDADAIIRRAVDAGINFIDTANVYNGGQFEEIVGRALKNLGISRQQVILATKVEHATGSGPNDGGATRYHIMDQVQASLKRLGTDHIDLYQLHSWDPVTPVEETLRALDDLVRQGYVRYVGVSNWAAWQIAKAVGVTERLTTARIQSVQAYYSLVGRDLEREIVPVVKAERLDLLVYSPLAGGYLSGKYRNGQGEGRRTTIDFPPVDQVKDRVEIRRSLIRTYRLIEVITVTMVLLLGRLWLPLYATLSRIRAFNLRQGTPLHLQPSSITEFSELNEVLARMVDRMQHDYQGMKAFTGNASHEMQAPRALINAKVGQLTQYRSAWIDGIDQASRRMSRLNQRLLLLAKIENGQFPDTHPVDLTAELMQRLADMDEVIAHKQLRISSVIDEPFRVQLPPFLAEGLVTNLLSNASRHNQTGGIIQVCSSADRFELSNTGPAPATDPTALFDRFRKGVANAKWVGPGLATVRRICHTYQLSIDYQYRQEMHTLMLVKQLTNALITST